MKNVHFAIPEIYGDSLSYYELLVKLVKELNVVIDNYNTIPDQIAEAVKNLDASQLFSAVLNQLINSIATDNTKSANAVKVYKKHDLLYATFDDTVNLYESLIDFSTGIATELIVGTNIREVNISELFIELRKLIDINKNNIDAVTAVANENTTEIATMHNDITSIENKITKNLYVTPDFYNGTDSEKIKLALLQIKDSGGTIVINREYNITEDIVIDHETDTNKELITFIGLGKKPIINMNGYSFVGSKTNTSNGGIKFSNITLVGTESCFKLNSDLIRILSSDCVFKGFKIVYDGIGKIGEENAYIQTIHSNNCYYWGISEVVMNVSVNAFDVNFISCICEQSKSFYRHNTSDISSTNSSAINISNCCIEGCTDTAIVLGTVNSAKISSCYFENQGNVIDIGDCRLSNGIMISDNACFPKNNKSFVILPPSSQHIIGEVQNNVVRGNGGYLFGVKDDGSSSNTLMIDIYNNSYVLGEYEPSQRRVIIVNDRVKREELIKKYNVEISGNKSIKTDINVNSGNGGKTLLAIESCHWSDGNATESRVSMIRCGYDKNFIKVVDIAKDNQSGSTEHLGEYSVSDDGYLIYTSKSYTKLMIIEN